MAGKKTQRYAISVSSWTYDRLRVAVPGSLAAFVDEHIKTALADPVILARLVIRCRARSRKEADTCTK